jgi:hypothetical protein
VAVEVDRDSDSELGGDEATTTKEQVVQCMQLHPRWVPIDQSLTQDELDQGIERLLECRNDECGDDDAYVLVLVSVFVLPDGLDDERDGAC